MFWPITILMLLLVNACLQLLICLEIYVNVQSVIHTTKYDQVVDVHRLKFDAYLKDFNKQYYNPEEYEMRFENFKASLKDIARLNYLEQNTVFGLTKFSDMSKQEFAELMLLTPYTVVPCDRRKPCDGKHAPKTEYENDITYIPPAFDWREKGVVKPVLNQKLCNGCWAFSIVGVMESMSAIRGLDHESRSIQELIDCSEYTNGCNLGNVKIAMDFLCRRPEGVVTEDEYPLSLADEPCTVPIDNNGRKVKNYATQCNRNETEILYDIANHGPLVAAVDASNWMNYIGGVIHRACKSVSNLYFTYSPGFLNHVVQIVGYSGYGDRSDVDLPYYIVRNSYGEDFGEQGYVRIAFNENICGIAEEVTKMDVF